MNEVNLTFYLNEEVTPEIFASKIALACARGGAIREGERVVSGMYVYEYIGDKETSMKDLGLGTSDTPMTIPDVQEIHMSAIKEHNE
jgi:hypothetical protein